jgi:hypothetical protein
MYSEFIYRVCGSERLLLIAVYLTTMSVAYALYMCLIAVVIGIRDIENLNIWNMDLWHGRLAVSLSCPLKLEKLLVFHPVTAATYLSSDLEILNDREHWNLIVCDFSAKKSDQPCYAFGGGFYFTALSASKST